MRLWIDTEYNGFRGALISMALVDEEGREWYEVLKCRSPSPWVAKHVMPKLHKQPFRSGLTKVIFCATQYSYSKNDLI